MSDSVAAMNRLLENALFTIGVQHLSQLPADQGAEVAFAGRSNVGKSSAINALTRRRSLARTSKTPGRTQQINFFELDDTRRIADLPGYGFARAPREVQRHWEKLVHDYLSQRESLRGIVSLMDIRHPLKDLDRQMVLWASEQGLPVHVLLTKADKLKRGPAKSALLKVRSELEKDGVNASVQMFSSLKKDGVEEAKAKLAEWLL